MELMRGLRGATCSRWLEEVPRTRTESLRAIEKQFVASIEAPITSAPPLQ